MPPPPRNEDYYSFSILLVSCPLEVSEKIARAVLDGHLAACVNILPGVRSLYLWHEKVEDANECLLLIKTRTALLSELEGVVRDVHPYEVPELIAIPVTYGYRPYLDWVVDSTEKS